MGATMLRRLLRWLYDARLEDLEEENRQLRETIERLRVLARSRPDREDHARHMTASEIKRRQQDADRMLSAPLYKPDIPGPVDWETK